MSSQYYNNQETTAIERGAKKVANETIRRLGKLTKNIIKAGVKKILALLSWKVILVVAIVAIILILLAVIVKEVRLKDTEDIPAATYEILEVEELSELVDIKGDKNSGYYLEFADNIDEKLEELLETEEQLEALKIGDISTLKKFIKAQIVTEFPDLGADVSNSNDNIIQGAIHIRRITPNRDIGAYPDDEITESTTETTVINSKVYDLKYVKPEEFQNLINAGSAEALEVFTLDENKMLNIATWSYNSQDAQPVKIEKFETALDYKSKLSKYSMSYEYLITMLVHTEDKVFTEGLADLAINSEYIIAIEDNVSISKETNQKDLVVTQREVETERVVREEELEQITTIQITENANQSIELSYVDCWFVKFSKEYSYSSEYIQSVTGSSSIDSGIVIDAMGKVNKNIYSNNYTDSEIVPFDGNSMQLKNKNYELVTTTTSKVKIGNISYEYITGNDIISGNEEAFIELYNDDNCKNVKSVYVPWLIENLEENPKTMDKSEITGYLFSQASGKNYNKSTIDFNEFVGSSFNTISGIYGGTLQEKVWFALKDLRLRDEVIAGAMGNIDFESGGFKASAVNGNGNAIGLIQWHGDRANKLRVYANHKGVDWTDEDTQIEFLVAEISGQGPAAETGIPDHRKKGWIKDEQIVGTYEQWVNSTTVEESTLYFMRYFESPSKKATYDQSGSWRRVKINKSEKIFKRISGERKINRKLWNN